MQIENFPVPSKSAGRLGYLTVPVDDYARLERNIKFYLDVSQDRCLSVSAHVWLCVCVCLCAFCLLCEFAGG